LKRSSRACFFFFVSSRSLLISLKEFFHEIKSMHRADFLPNRKK
jgi:hypothetical protein